MTVRTFTFTETTTMTTMGCCNCAVLFALPEEMDKQLQLTHATFYCPNGHGQSYNQETEAERLRRDVKRNEAALA